MPRVSTRRIAPRWWAALPLLATPLGLSGCNSLWRGAPDPAAQAEALSELMKAPEPPALIRDATVPHGIQPLQIEGVGVVNGLPGTGGAPDPSRLRDELLDEIKRHNIDHPNQFLETDGTALVRVRATVPPGARRGDPLDLRLLAPKISRATDLHGGWLLDTWLRHQQLLGGMVRKSDLMAVGTGAVLTRADFAPGADESLKLEGNVLGGGRVQETRKLGLVLKPRYQHAKVAATIADAINTRFFFFDGSSRRGVAKAIEDDFIEIELHPRYRNQVVRFMDVVRASSGRPHETTGQERLAELGELLTDPSTVADAAIQLEGIGENSVPTLLKALETSDPKIRFFVAQSLAYLDQTEAIETLEQIIAEQPEFRNRALAALEGFRHPQVVEAYRRLFDAPSLEARYGAFCSLRRREDGRRTLAGRPLKSFTVYSVPSTTTPTVVVSLREAPEIVLLGEVAPITLRKSIIGPSGLMLTPDSSEASNSSAGGVRISRFEAGKPDQRVIVAPSIAEIARGIAEVGGGYGDVIAVLRAAKDQGDLVEQLAIDPVPQ